MKRVNTVVNHRVNHVLGTISSEDSGWNKTSARLNICFRYKITSKVYQVIINTGTTRVWKQDKLKKKINSILNMKESGKSLIMLQSKKKKHITLGYILDVASRCYCKQHTKNSPEGAYVRAWKSTVEILVILYVLYFSFLISLKETSAMLLLALQI